MSEATDQALVQKILDTLGRIDGKTVELQNGINSKMHLLPAPVADRVAKGWDEFCALMREVWDDITEFVTNMGKPWVLISAANAWVSTVGGPVSSQVNSADAGYLKVDTNWDGDAADAYRDTLPLQKDMLESIQGYTDAISTGLNVMAGAIVAFWVALIAAIVALFKGIAAAIASTATVFGMPAAPFLAAGAAVVCAGSVLAGGSILRLAASSVNSTLLAKLSDGSNTYQGHWPPAVTA
jgi:hypothetical protein